MSLFNPLIKLWYQHNNPQNWFPYIFLKNELREYDKDQSIFPLVIILSSTITFFLGDVWILSEKNYCLSLRSKQRSRITVTHALSTLYNRELLGRHKNHIGQGFFPHMRTIISTPFLQRARDRFSKVPIINAPGKLSSFTLKIKVSIVLHLTW